MGIVNGRGDGTFDPNGSITRREAAIMLMHTAEIVGKKAKGSSLEYEDAADIVWPAAVEAVDFVTRADIMRSTSNERALFSPLGYYTQEQALTTICNMLP